MTVTCRVTRDKRRDSHETYAVSNAVSPDPLTEPDLTYINKYSRSLRADADEFGILLAGTFKRIDDIA